MKKKINVLEMLFGASILGVVLGRIFLPTEAVAPAAAPAAPPAVAVALAVTPAVTLWAAPAVTLPSPFPEYQQWLYEWEYGISPLTPEERKAAQLTAVTPVAAVTPLAPTLWYVAVFDFSTNTISIYSFASLDEAHAFSLTQEYAVISDTSHLDANIENFLWYGPIPSDISSWTKVYK